MAVVVPFVAPASSPNGAGAQPKKKPPEPYNLDNGFERALVTALCGKPKLFAKLVPYIDGDCLALPEARLAMEAAEAFGRDLKRGPESALVVLQRLRRWVGEGKITLAQVQAVGDMFDAAEDAGLPSDEGILTEMVPLLQRRVEREGLEEGFIEFQRRGDVAKALRRIEKAKTMATSDATIGVVLGPASFAELERLKSVERLKTGILELDDALSGGPRRGTGNMFMGNSSSGKSMGLIQVACYGAIQGVNTAYATLELPVPIITARMKANLTNVPIDLILDSPLTCGARELLEEVMEGVAMGCVHVAAFTPKVTTVHDLLLWVKDLEEDTGVRFDQLVVDYADKLSAGSAKSDESSYRGQGDVYDQLYTWARDEGRWVWTASQSNRQKDKKAKLGLDDVSDSMGKIRNFDTVITLNPDEDGGQMTWGIAKNRMGKRGGNIGPLPTDFVVARIAPIVIPTCQAEV